MLGLVVIATALAVVAGALWLLEDRPALFGAGGNGDPTATVAAPTEAPAIIEPPGDSPTSTPEPTPTPPPEPSPTPTPEPPPTPTVVSEPTLPVIVPVDPTSPPTGPSTEEDEPQIIELGYADDEGAQVTSVVLIPTDASQVPAAKDLRPEHKEALDVIYGLLLQEPEIVLADEPIASLDPRNAAKVMDALKTINREDGITVIVNLHHLGTARAYCDRIVGMATGRIVFDGAPDALSAPMAREIYGQEGEEAGLEPNRGRRPQRAAPEPLAAAFASA